MIDNNESLPLIGLDMLDNSIIKVIGVGGGGCNAVNYMFRQGIRDASFLVCNTDTMALQKMSVPAKLQLGPGLGAGGRPEKAAAYADESENRIREALDDGTRMVFITAGMGGGTGTGASPVVARIAQDMGILTVGIVTIPFAFEGRKAIQRAMRGVAKLAQFTDALLVINNEKLRLLFPELDTPNAFEKADAVLCNAAKSIAEIITIPGYINTDFQDVYNTLKDGNMAIMNVGMAEGENRITHAIEDALNSPLVNTNDVHGASRILLNFYCSKEHAILMQELDQVTQFCDSVGDDVDVRWGISYDDTLGEKAKVTIIATGYSVSDIPGLDEAVQVAEEEVPPAAQPTKTIDEAIDDFYDTRTKEQKEQETKQEEVAQAETEEENNTAQIKATDTVEEYDDEPIFLGSSKPSEKKDESPAIKIEFDDVKTTDESQEEEKVPAWKRGWMRRR